MKYLSTISLLIFILNFNPDFILAQDRLKQNIPADKISDEIDAFALQRINPNPSSIESPLDPNAIEEVFGADSVLFGPSGFRGRGNIFFCNNPRTIIEHKLYLRLNAVTNLWFVIYEGDSLNATYDLVNSVEVPSQGPGLGWYSSGPISYTLQNGKYYLIYAQWDSAAVYYNDQGVTPYPVQCSFGEQVSGIGWFWSPVYTVPPPATQDQTGEILGTGVSYYQTIITDVPPVVPTNLSAEPVSATEIQLTWNDDSDNETGFEIQRRAGIFYTSIDTVGENVTTFTDVGRTPGTEYCYRVRAINLAGNSPYTDPACATPLPLPEAPSGLTATPVSSSEIELAWTDNSDNEDGFTVQRELSPGVYVTIGTTGSNETTFIDTGLTVGTEYCYRVQAFNVGGSSAFSSDACATISVNFPGEANLTSPPNNSTQVSINPVLNWETALNTDSYTLQISLNSGFNPPAVLELSGIVNTTFSVPSQTPLPNNTTLYWRVRGVNSNGAGNWSPTWSFTTVSTMDLSSTVIFPNRTNPDDYSATDYKIVGLPGNGNINVSTLLSGSQGTDWEVYNDNGADSNYYVKFDGSNPFRFTAGKSFWIIRKGNLSINQTVTAASVNESGYVEINLANEDFNLITNPFLVAVPWAVVLTLNGLPPSTPLRQYSGGWSNANTMQPFVGYLFDNVTDLTSLRIPYPIGSSALPKQNNPDIWRVKIDLSCGELIDETTSFGVSKEASQDYDELDFRKPRAPGNIPAVYFDRPAWDKGYSFYSTDIRPGFDEIQVWDFKVSSELREQINLSFSGIDDIPDQMEIYLVDEDRAKSVNLREQVSYEFIPVKDISDFKILVGKSDHINSLLSNIIPTEFELGNNFPNPFNPSTTFQISVPQPSEIKISIYNILGEEIRTLYRESVEAGKHWYRWDGKDDQGFVVPSGIYFNNLTSNTGINISKKMILMK